MGHLRSGVVPVLMKRKLAATSSRFHPSLPLHRCATAPSGAPCERWMRSKLNISNTSRGFKLSTSKIREQEAVQAQHFYELEALRAS